jgi:DNA polymerase-3 subunit beta
MKFKISKGALLDALQIVQGIVSARSTLPILANVLIKADKNKLSLSTTDLEVSVKCSVAADVTKSGSTTMPARRLVSIVKELPAEEVDFDIDEKNVATISCGAAFFKIVGLSDDEFPPMPDFKGKFKYALEQKAFKEMLNKISYAASADETRYVLNGVLLSFKNEKITMVATDGRRLGLVEQDIEFPKEAEVDLIVPSKAINELEHSLNDEGDVKISASSNQVAFEFGDILVISKLIEDTYPNYKQVIPSECEERVTLERENLLTAVKRVALLTSEKSNSVRLTFKKNKLRIEAITPEVGEAHETMALKYSGKEISVAFNPEYMLEPLRRLTSDEVYLELTDELSPGVLKCEQPFLYVLMPMRIS